MCIQMHAYTIFLNHLSVRYRHYVLLFLSMFTGFSPKQGHFLISAMLIQYYFLIHSSYLIIPTTSFICFFFPRLESHPRLCIVLNCPVSLTSFNLGEFLLHELDILKKNKSVTYKTSI